MHSQSITKNDLILLLAKMIFHNAESITLDIYDNGIDVDLYSDEHFINTYSRLGLEM